MKTKRDPKAEIADWTEAGRAAWKLGKQPKDNPYAYEKKAAFWWLRGWTAEAIDAVAQDQGDKARSWPV